MGNIGHYIAIT